jgi:hypothetical protein
LSGAKVNGLGLAGPNSSLFVSFASFYHELRDDNDGLDVALLAENARERMDRIAHPNQ